MATATEEHKCTAKGCDYSAKTKGAVTAHIKKKHGKGDKLASVRNGIPGAPRPGGVYNDKPLQAAPSGIPSIDYAIGIGGIPRGAIAEIFGPSQSGKTFTALTFSAHAQMNGGRAGYMNAERAPMETFLPLVPNLDIDALEYGEPPVAGPGAGKADKEMWDGSGQATLEASRRMIKSGEFDVWTIDSVHSLTSRDALGAEIGSSRAQAAIARMMSEAIPVMEHEIHNTQTLCIFVNHVKQIPMAKHGRDWSKPGGSALDYYCSIQLKVTAGKPYYRAEDNRRIGHVVRVKVHKNKVALPHATAEYDLFYGSGKLKEDPRTVTPGVDVTSAWKSVLKEDGRLIWTGNKWVDSEDGTVIGVDQDVMEVLGDEGSDLFQAARSIVYPVAYNK